MRQILAILLLTLSLAIAAELRSKRKEPPRDCSDAPNKDTLHTCLMVSDLCADDDGKGNEFLLCKKERNAVCFQLRTMDRLTRRRIARQAARNPNRPQQGGQRPQQQLPPRPLGPPEWLTPIPVPANARGQVAYHPYDCMTLACLCPFFAGQMQNGHCVLRNGQLLNMAYRKEYRMLTDDERNRWHNALATLKMNGVYDQLSRVHFEEGTNSGAHSGPGFLPWHREFLKRVEIALRMVDPSVAVPYWDSVMDGYLPDPRDSILFSNLFAGETDFYGNVIQGPFAYWRTLEGRSTILRNLGREGSLINENQVNNVVAQNTIENILAYTAPQPGCPYPNNYGAIEYIHSNVHLWIGGDMKPPSTSANEPIFFMHHSFVDYLWELWRQLKQPRWLREVAYSNDHPYCTNQLHFSWAWMRPFPYLSNRDGLSNSYTDQMYRYAPRASCSFQNPNCGSPYLFCDTRGYPHCVAKIKMNGNCQGFENFDACYMGRCWWGRCIPAQFGPRAFGSKTHKITKPLNASLAVDLITLEEDVRPVPTKMLAPKFTNCFNRSPCCGVWADRGQCVKQPEYMALYCAASCGSCTPTFNITSSACFDYHPMCGAFKKQGMCEGEGEDFMAENCRASCGICTESKMKKCYKDDKLVLPDVPIGLVDDVQDAVESDVKERVRLAKKHIGFAAKSFVWN
ncbi:shTK domain protein [Oesophagostomum dentatum]|uniref:ShTK domain protein n=1 Tax=Oesophagostomum dentatum TaxID=61180 RepID=A0A0B1TMI8_OESDE|nr:shTK domain protein [Oesophagostomum dentatum]